MEVSRQPLRVSFVFLPRGSSRRKSGHPPTPDSGCVWRQRLKVRWRVSRRERVRSATPLGLLTWAPWGNDLSTYWNRESKWRPWRGRTEDVAEGLLIGVSYASGIGSSPESRGNSASAVNPRVITTAPWSHLRLQYGYGGRGKHACVCVGGYVCKEARA